MGRKKARRAPRTPRPEDWRDTPAGLRPCGDCAVGDADDGRKARLCHLCHAMGIYEPKAQG